MDVIKSKEWNIVLNAFTHITTKIPKKIVKCLVNETAEVIYILRAPVCTERIMSVQ